MIFIMCTYGMDYDIELAVYPTLEIRKTTRSSIDENRYKGFLYRELKR